MIDTLGFDIIRPVYLPNPVNRSNPLNHGRVAWFLTLPGLEGGQYWYDLMGLYKGQLTNMTTSASGWRGTTRPGGYGHLLFDGSDDYVVCRTSAILAGTSNFSIFAWVRTGATDTTNGRAIYCERAASGNDILKFDTQVATQYSNSIGFTYRNDAGTLIQTSGAFTINDGLWHRVGIAKAGSAFTFYGDGKQTNTGSFGSTDTFTDPGLESRIAGDAGDTASRFSGSIDDVSLWNRTLSPAEVKADYDLSRQGYPGVLNRLSSTFFSMPASISAFRAYHSLYAGSRSA